MDDQVFSSGINTRLYGTKSTAKFADEIGSLNDVDQFEKSFIPINDRLKRNSSASTRKPIDQPLFYNLISPVNTSKDKPDNIYELRRPSSLRMFKENLVNLKKANSNVFPINDGFRKADDSNKDPFLVNLVKNGSCISPSKRTSAPIKYVKDSPAKLAAQKQILKTLSFEREKKEPNKIRMELRSWQESLVSESSKLNSGKLETVNREGREENLKNAGKDEEKKELQISFDEVKKEEEKIKSDLKVTSTNQTDRSNEEAANIKVKPSIPNLQLGENIPNAVNEEES